MGNSFRRNFKFNNKRVKLFVIEKYKIRFFWLVGRLDYVSFKFISSVLLIYCFKCLIV